MFLPRFFFLISFIKISGNIWVSDFIFKRLFNAVFWNSTLSQPDVDTQYIRRVIWESFNSHFAYNKKTFYETYSRVRQEIGGFLSDSGKIWSNECDLDVPALQISSSNLENYLFSLNYLAHVIRWLISICWGPIYFSAEFMTCFVTVWTDLGSALKGLHLTLTH